MVINAIHKLSIYSSADKIYFTFIVSNMNLFNYSDTLQQRESVGIFDCPPNRYSRRAGGYRFAFPLLAFDTLALPVSIGLNNPARFRYSVRLREYRFGFALFFSIPSTDHRVSKKSIRKQSDTLNNPSEAYGIHIPTSLMGCFIINVLDL